MTNLLATPRFLSRSIASSPLREGMFQIRDDDVGAKAFRCLDECRAICDGRNHIEAAAEQLDQALRNNRVIVGDQNAGAARGHTVRPRQTRERVMRDS